MNLYKFVSNNPVNRWDYLGMSDTFSMPVVNAAALLRVANGGSLTSTDVDPDWVWWQDPTIKTEWGKTGHSASVYRVDPSTGARTFLFYHHAELNLEDDGEYDFGFDDLGDFGGSDWIQELEEMAYGMELLALARAAATSDGGTLLGDLGGLLQGLGSGIASFLGSGGSNPAGYAYVDWSRAVYNLGYTATLPSPGGYSAAEIAATQAAGLQYLAARNQGVNRDWAAVVNAGRDTFGNAVFQQPLTTLATAGIGVAAVPVALIVGPAVGAAVGPALVKPAVVTTAFRIATIGGVSAGGAASGHKAISAFSLQGYNWVRVASNIDRGRAALAAAAKTIVRSGSPPPPPP